MELKMNDLFDNWLRNRGLSNKTIREYCALLRSFPYDEFNNKTVAMFLQSKRNNGVCRAFLNNYKLFLQQSDPDNVALIKINVPLFRGRRKRHLPIYPTEEEVLTIEKGMNNERNKLMLLISFYACLRPSGMLNLKTDDFLLDIWLQDENKPCQIKVTEKGNRERIIFIPSSLIKRMKKALINAPPNKKLWNIRYSRWHEILTKISKKTIGKAISPHKLRHGGAVWLLNNGYTIEEIKEILGHESISTTQIYIHLDKTKLLEKYNLIKTKI